MDGRTLKVNESVARSREDRPPRAEGTRNFDFDARKLYFGNLSWAGAYTRSLFSST
jgi:hypothetical protein